MKSLSSSSLSANEKEEVIKVEQNNGCKSTAASSFLYQLARLFLSAPTPRLSQSLLYTSSSSISFSSSSSSVSSSAYGSCDGEQTPSSWSSSSSTSCPSPSASPSSSAPVVDTSCVPSCSASSSASSSSSVSSPSEFLYSCCSPSSSRNISHTIIYKGEVYPNWRGSVYITGEPKPVWRGYIHTLAALFVVPIQIAILVYFMINNSNSNSNNEMRHTPMGEVDVVAGACAALYIMTVWMVYIISASFHCLQWRTQQQYQVMQRIDHATIFLLGPGIDSTLALLLLRSSESSSTATFVSPWSLYAAGVSLLLCAYMTSLIGIIQSFVKPLHDHMTLSQLVLYAVVGAMLLPFSYHLYAVMTTFEFVCMLLLWVTALTSMMVYAHKWCDLVPDVFGYHEMFHVVVVVANTLAGMLVTSIVCRLNHNYV